MHLNQDQFKQITNAVSDLSAHQLAWVEGYLFALAEQKSQSGETLLPNNALAAQPNQAAATETSITTILYGTQSGNSKKLAEQLLKRLQDSGRAAKAINMKDYRPQQLKKESHVVLIISTHGNGEAPDEARAFFKFIDSKRAPSLKHLEYAVLALGDSSYDEYCYAGIHLDKRFAELGAKPLVDRGELDLDFADAANTWQDDLLAKLPKEDNLIQFPHASPHAENDQVAVTNTLDAELIQQIRLTTDASDKAVQHIEFSLEDSAITYKPGDIAAVNVENSDELVTSLIAATGLDAANMVSLGKDKASVSLHEALLKHKEITSVTRKQLQNYADTLNDAELTSLLSEGIPSGLADADWLDIINQYPLSTNTQVDAQAFVDLLRPLKAREYSIASSLEAHPEELHLLVKQVEYNHNDRVHQGAGSNWLAQLEAGKTANITIKPNPNFKLPDAQDTPIIMIGAGTGVAPFRSFLAEREALELQGNSWLFFGEQHFRTDFLYQTEWLQHLKTGTLEKLDVAFSRDQAERIYVQHRLYESAAEVYAWLQRGAHIYVCGDMNKMAKDVHETLINIVAEQGKLDREAASEWLEQLMIDKRYQRDIY